MGQGLSFLSSLSVRYCYYELCFANDRRTKQEILDRLNISVNKYQYALKKHKYCDEMFEKLEDEFGITERDDYESVDFFLKNILGNSR